MSYLDKCFCTFYTECTKGDKCDRALTPQIRLNAEKWMKNAPINIFVNKPKCFEDDTHRTS